LRSRTGDGSALAKAPQLHPAERTTPPNPATEPSHPICHGGNQLPSATYSSDRNPARDPDIHAGASRFDVIEHVF
jgi:hypothetical protein